MYGLFYVGYNENKNKKKEIQQLNAEINKFKTEEGMNALSVAEKIFSAGVNNFLDVYKNCLDSSFVLSRKSDFKISEKTVKKYFENGLTEFDSSIIDNLFDKEEEIENKIFATLDKMKKANE